LRGFALVIFAERITAADTRIAHQQRVRLPRKIVNFSLQSNGCV
jgi:hypothetical protein